MMMIRNLTIAALALLAVFALAYALAATDRSPAIDGAHDTSPFVSPPIEAMPPPREPFDETPITPVESAGAPMWP